MCCPLSRSDTLILEYGDWKFDVDVEATKERTSKYSFDHCECGYCKNFYEVIDHAHPQLRPALEPFGIHLEGPCELVPFEPTLMLACYRVDGKILRWGRSSLYVSGAPLLPEAGDEHTFLLWVGELPVPWMQEEAMEDVVSPANLPEFMDRMRNLWALRHGNGFFYS